MKKTIFWVLLLGVAVWAFDDRRMLMMRAMAISEGGEPPALAEAPDEGPDARWYDDYFTVHVVADNVFAIGEPRYPHHNYSYLLTGDSRALLFDGGPGMRDIREVAESLTDQPITFLPSHLHFDHVANDVSFERIALLDIEPIRSRAEGNTFSPSNRQFLGFMEGREAPVWEIAEWIEPGSSYDLGGRSVKIMYTPGHTTDSVSVYDADHGIVFSGDYLYPGGLWVFTPTSSMGDYLKTAGPLLQELPSGTLFLGAHRQVPPGLPTLTLRDLHDLEQALQKLHDDALEGEGTWPVTYPVNDNVSLVAEPRWLQDW